MLNNVLHKIDLTTNILGGSLLIQEQIILKSVHSRSQEPIILKYLSYFVLHTSDALYILVTLDTQILECINVVIVW